MRDRYTIKIAGKYNFDRLEPIVGKLPDQSRSQRRAISYPHKGSLMFVPIKSIELVTEDSRVVDLQVAGTNKFFAGVGGILIHNCGAQYALNDEAGLMPSRMAMGHWSSFHHTPAFDGRICDKCYYQNYNIVLKNMAEKIKHERFY